MKDTPWLSAPELAAWTRLASILELLPSALDMQLRRDADLTHFDYRVLSRLSESKDKTLRMTRLAQLTNASLPRLSHVLSRLETRGYVKRNPCIHDRRAMNATLTGSGWEKVVGAAPGHVVAVRSLVFEELNTDHVAQLTEISDRNLSQLYNDGVMRAIYTRHAPDVPANDEAPK